MIIDLARPLLDWTNPQKAIKQNLNVLFATLADIGILAALAMVVIRLVKSGMSAKGGGRPSLRDPGVAFRRQASRFS